MASKYYRGIYTPVNPDKYAGSGKPIFRSSWERKLMIMFDTNPNILKWASEPIKIPYKNPFTGKYTVYVPDFIVSYVDAAGVQKAEIIEIKPSKETYLDEAKSERSRAAVALNTYKWAAAQAFARQHNMVFRVMTEKDIFNNPGKKRRTSRRK